VQPQRQPPFDRGGEPGRGAGRDELLAPQVVTAQVAARRSSDLVDVEQQHVQGVQPGSTCLAELVSQNLRVLAAAGAVDERGADEAGVRAPAVATDQLAEFQQLVVADRGGVRVSAPQRQSGQLGRSVMM
jgi:hypothetical protein